MIDKALWEFSRIDDLYERFHPYSPYGKRLKKRCPVYYEVKELDHEHRLMELFLSYLTDPVKTVKLDQLKARLTRIMLIPTVTEQILDLAEIFLIKRFVVNSWGIYGELKDSFATFFDFNTFPYELMELLALGQGQTESFTLTGDYDGRLTGVRAEIDALLNEEQTLVRDYYAVCEKTLDLDFSSRDFLIVPDALYGRLSQHMHLVNIEIYDESHLLVRPVWSQKLIVLRRKIYELRAEESSFEKDVLRRISEQIATAGGELQRLCEILGRLDCALAKAELAVKYGMTRPKIADELTVRQGRLLSLEQECGENGREYTPLNVSLSDKGALLYGSNMGGKTVVMRTIAFLQLLTQCGFFVPAGGFVTRIYRSLQFVGANERRSFKGLSSFGCEVWEMQEKWAQGEFPRFFVIDEFAATTNAREATALSNALLYELHREPGTYYLMATHYVDKRHEVKDLKIWHMQGIDHHKLQSLRDAFDAASTLTEKVRLLTSCMVYRINEESSLVKDEEALMIAQLLGFNPNILARAKSYLEN